MKSAQDFISQHKPNIEYSSYYHESDIEDMINKARVEALNEACNVVKTYKVGNSGSWYDAAVDRTQIIELSKQFI